MNEVYNILSNVKIILLKENTTKQIKELEEYKLDKFYIDINKLYNDLKKIKNNEILINGFIDKYIDELRQIKHFLLERKELELEKSLGIWKSNTVQNARINFATVVDDIDISKLTFSEKEKHLIRLEKYNTENEKNQKIISQDYSKLNKKDKLIYDKTLEKINNNNILIEKERFETAEKLFLWNNVKAQFPNLY